MPSNDSTQDILVTHAVLTGLTPLIPIPFVDDLVYSYFLCSMVQRLATAHGMQLTPDAVQTLAAEKGGSCLLGCAGTVLLYPLKKIFSKIFFFLEWKRAADIISRTYYQGFLIDAAFQTGVLPDAAATVRAAIDRVLARTNTSLVNRAAYGVVNQSKGALKSAGALLVSFLPKAGKATSDAEVGQRVAAVEEEEKQQVRGIVGRLQAAIANLPSEHFEELRGELERELNQSSYT
jgi:hypothetical protein